MQKLPKNPTKIFDKNLTKIWWDKNFYIFLNINTKQNKMKPLKSQIKIDAIKMIEASNESIFAALHEKYKTVGGDISPMQQYQLEEEQENLVHIITEQVFQNIDFTKVNLQELDRDELIELAYSLDWNGSWDADEEGQSPITKDELILI
jgi:hypothetical protein